MLLLLLSLILLLLQEDRGGGPRRAIWFSPSLFWRGPKKLFRCSGYIYIHTYQFSRYLYLYKYIHTIQLRGAFRSTSFWGRRGVVDRFGSRHCGRTQGNCTSRFKGLWLRLSFCLLLQCFLTVFRPQTITNIMLKYI